MKNKEQKKQLWDFQFKNIVVNCQWEPKICCICNREHDKKKMKSFHRLNNNLEKEYKYICRNCFIGNVINKDNKKELTMQCNECQETYFKNEMRYLNKQDGSYCEYCVKNWDCFLNGKQENKIVKYTDRMLIVILNEIVNSQLINIYYREIILRFLEQIEGMELGELKIKKMCSKCGYTKLLETADDYYVCER